MSDPTGEDTSVVPQSTFAQIRRVDPDGNEYWTGRDLMPLLAYTS
jgi:hypothetical protein